MSPSRGSIVITGASSGIGAACAQLLDARGFRVFAGVRHEEDAERLRAVASERLTSLRIDVTDAASIAAAAEHVTEAIGDEGLAGLVNNAGIAVPGALEFLSLDRLRQQLEVNVIGQVAVTQAFLPALRRGPGRVVNTGSISGRVSVPFVGAYAMSKHAIEAFDDALRMELHPWRIHVALIEPGSVATPIWEKGLQLADEIVAEMPEDGRRLYARQVEAARAASEDLARSGIAPEAVARAVAHALESRRPKTRYVVGRDARLQAVLRRWLPDRWLDALIRRQLGV